MLKDNNGYWISNPDDLKDHITEFYKNLFSGNKDTEEEFHGEKLILKYLKEILIIWQPHLDRGN